MRLKEADLAEHSTILIAVSDRVLAESLRFSLELEGFDVEVCHEHSLLSAMAGAGAAGCLVLDYDVFARMANFKNERRFAGFDFPVVLMVNHKTARVVATAEQAGVSQVVETPLLGGVLLDAIRAALDAPLNPTRHLN
jgi:FixJ family two-component response regulator